MPPASSTLKGRRRAVFPGDVVQSCATYSGHHGEFQVAWHTKPAAGGVATHPACGDVHLYARVPGGFVSGLLDAPGHAPNPRTLELARTMLNRVRMALRQAGVSLSTILRGLHDELQEMDATGSCSFIQMDVKRRVVHAATSASTPPVLYRNGEPPMLLGESSIILGAPVSAVFKVTEHRLPRPGTGFIIGQHSDGNEVETPGGALFDPVKRFAEIFDTGLSAQANIALAFDELRKHHPVWVDDVSLQLVCVPPDDSMLSRRRPPLVAGTPPRAASATFNQLFDAHDCHLACA